MSQNGQALPRINYHDPPHLNTNHSHLHLITAAITTLIRAPVSVHSVVRSCGSYKDRYATLLNHLPEYTYLNTLPAITYLLFASHFQIPGKLWTLETFGLFGISVCSAPAKDTEAQSESQHTLHYVQERPPPHSHLKKFTTVVTEFAFNKHLLFKHHLCVRQFRNRRSDQDSYRMSASDPFQELVDTLKRILTRSASPPLPTLPLQSLQLSALLLLSCSPVPWPDQRPTQVIQRSAMALYYSVH